MSDIATYWPKSLSHLANSNCDVQSEHVVIAEISDAPHLGCRGFRTSSTALVPVDQLDAILREPGGIGWEVKAWGPNPCVDAEVSFDTRFWIDGRAGQEERFQTLLNAWKQHDQEVVMPDSVMLMTYGLVPRYVAGGVVCWDDPRRPVYDVVRAKSHVDYNRKQGTPLAQVTVRREYLEDYCSLKRCAAVAVFYEERFSSGDSTFAELLMGREGREFRLPGRLLGISELKDPHFADAPQMSRVWGAQLLIKPARRPITDEEEPHLVWPDHEGEMTLEKAAKDWLYGYVSDVVLEEYESRPEFSIHPETGGVTYGGWWGTSYTNRVGRNHIRVELKKLYEGCPPHVIAHWHRFAVPKAIAESDQARNGARNVATRAKELIGAYLGLTEALTHLSDRLGSGFSQDDVGTLVTSDVEYRGWWSPGVMKPLTAVIRLSASQEDFLQRAIALFKLIELLKPAPIRNMLLAMHVPQKDIKDLGALKLLGTLCQLVTTAGEHGFELPQDSAPVRERWDATRRLRELEGLFALNGLRSLAAHAPSAELNRKLAEHAVPFGFDVADTKTGWGHAIDALYDRLISDLDQTSVIVRAV